MNPKVDAYIANAKLWPQELAALRVIVLECGLTEEYKWRQPCYTYNGANIVILGPFKAFCTLAFFKGALLNDAEKLLKKQGENTQSGRILAFTSVKQIVELKPTIKAYIYEALEIEKAGLKVDTTAAKNIDYCEELADKMESDNAFKTAFEALTAGKKRAYNMHFAAAKQAKTRIDRIEKYTPRIMAGKGIHDCVCGHSKRMPNCDGSHKNYEKLIY